MKPIKPFLAAVLVVVSCVIPGCAEPPWLSTPESISAFRAKVESARPASSSYALASIEDRAVALSGRDIGIRIYDPGGNAPKPALIYVHGACLVAGSLNSHDEISRYLAKKSNSVVIAIDYRLAPEFKYPTAHDDVYEVVQWVWNNSEALGIDRSRFGIAGESSGAYFAAATALRNLDESAGPEFSFLLLVFAVVDGDISSGSPCKNHYFETVEDSRSRYGSPLRVDDLAGMPRTYNIFGEEEGTRADQELFMRKLGDSGVPTKAYRVDGVGHDVYTWLAAKEGVPAHEMAIRFIEMGFAAE